MREGHLSPWVTPWGLGGCPWKSAGGGRGEGWAPPPRASPDPQAVTGPGGAGLCLESCVEGTGGEGGGLGLASGVDQAGRSPLRRTRWSSWCHGFPGDPERGRLGLFPAQLPPRSGKKEGGIGGSKREPGTFWRLGKADPQGHPALAVLHPRKQLRYQDWVSGCREETPRGRPGGEVLKEAAPQAGCLGKGRLWGMASQGKGH